MAFILTDNNGHYLTNKCTVVDNVADASIWKSKGKASNFLSHIPSTISDTYTFEVKSLTSGYDDACVDNVIDDFTASLTVLYNTYLESSDRMDYLSKKLQELDLAIEDLKHAIEFKELNVVEGYKLYKRLHDILNERRKCKNEVEKVLHIKSALGKSNIPILLRSLESVDNKSYLPRVLLDLFDTEEK